MLLVFRYLHQYPEKMNVGNYLKMRGVTLLELLIALLIASVMLAMGIPSFRAVLDNQRMTAATNELVMSLNLAKSEAIKRVAYVSVCKSINGVACTGASDWNDGWIVFANTDAVSLSAIDVGDEIIRIYPKHRDSIDMTPSGTIGDFVSFRPSGTVGTTVGNMTGTLTVCDERGAEHARGVVVEPSGRWRISKDLAHDGNSRMHLQASDHLNMLDVCVVWGDNASNPLIHKLDFWNGIFTCNVKTGNQEAWKPFDMFKLSNNHIISDDDFIRD